MSAEYIPVDWRFWRAINAIRAGATLDFSQYALEFECDEDEVLLIFHDAACELGVSICVRSVGAPPVLH